MFRKIFTKILRFFKKFFTKKVRVPSKIQGPHDCGLISLYIVYPSISIEKMTNAFMHCCEWWEVVP